jgi:hypothetical protein
MTTEPQRPEPGPDAGVEDIQADIEKTRSELGETVSALSSKLDVKEQARQKAADTKERVSEGAHAAKHAATDNPQRTVPIAALVVAAVLTLGIVIYRRRR